MRGGCWLSCWGICPAFGDEAVADPGFGLDVLFAGFGFEFFAELSDEDAEVFGLVYGVSAPDGGEQGAMGDDLAVVAGQVGDELEFFGGEVDGASLDGDGVGDGVDEEVSGLNGAGGALRGAAEVGADAGEEFVVAEGLGDVVVGASVEGFDLGALVVADGEYEDGGGGGGADGAADVDAGHGGHHEVGDDEVRRPFAVEQEAFFGVVCGADAVSLRSERGAEDASDLGFIVDNQDSAGHGICLQGVPSLLQHHGGAEFFMFSLLMDVVEGGVETRYSYKR